MNVKTALSRGRKSYASPVRISRVLLYAETEVRVPTAVSKSSFSEPRVDIAIVLAAIVHRDRRRHVIRVRRREETREQLASSHGITK